MLKVLIAYIKTFPGVWMVCRIDIANPIPDT